MIKHTFAISNKIIIENCSKLTTVIVTVDVVHCSA